MLHAPVSCVALDGLAMGEFHSIARPGIFTPRSFATSIARS